MVAEQALNEGELVRPDIDRRAEGSVLVPVNGLEDRPSGPDTGEVLFQDAEVIRVWMQRGYPAPGPLPAVIAVIVVPRDVGEALLADQANHPAGDRGLSGG